MEKTEKKGRKIFKLISKILKVILTIFAVGFLCIVLLQRVSDNKLSFFNYRMFTVVSGSMYPKYKIGDVLVAKDIDAEDIKIGDAVSYLGTTGDVKGKVITHEVKEIEIGEDGKYSFTTQGLTNIIEDPIVHEDQLYGKVVYKVFTLSLIYKIIRTNIGFFICIVLPLMFIIISEIILTLLEKENKKRGLE